MPSLGFYDYFGVWGSGVGGRGSGVGGRRRRRSPEGGFSARADGVGEGIKGSGKMRLDEDRGEVRPLLLTRSPVG